MGRVCRKGISSALQLVIGDERAEVSLHDLERLEYRPLLENLAVILRALTVVAATGILGWKTSDGVPTPAARCRGVGIDGRCQLVVATVAHVAKAVEVSVLRLDEPEPRVPERVGPAQGLEERRVDLTRAVCSDNRLLTKTRDSVDVPANKPGTWCSPEDTHLSPRSLLDRLWAMVSLAGRETLARAGHWACWWRGGGRGALRQPATTCIRIVDGFPAPNATMYSSAVLLTDPGIRQLQPGAITGWRAWGTVSAHSARPARYADRLCAGSGALAGRTGPGSGRGA